MAAPRPMYDVTALEAGIKQAEVTIAGLEAAIEGQRATQKEYRRMIRELEARAEGPKIHVEIVREE